MHDYKITFRVNNQRTEQTVSAVTISSAKKIIESQYGGSKISWISVKQVK